MRCAGNVRALIRVQPFIGARAGVGESYCYRVARHDLRADQPIVGLEPFQTEGAAGGTQVSWKGPSTLAANSLQPLYDGPGWIGNEWRQLTCRKGQEGYWLEVAQVGTFFVAEDGGTIDCVGAPSEVKGVAEWKSSVMQAVVGPCLILALALHGVWSWHASAVTMANRTAIFLGESGQGKSTLAAWLEREGNGHVQLLADDIMPVALDPIGVEVMPHFPQPRLSSESHDFRAYPERVQLNAVYLLRQPPGGDSVEIRPVGRQAATLALVRHTVASRLFAPDLLVKHLDFCLHAAARLPVSELVYPHVPDALPRVRDLLLQATV